MRILIVTLVLLGTALGSGCSICSPGFLDDYATVGGKWQRSNPTEGRVGSLFSDPGSLHPQGGHEVYEGEVYQGEVMEGDVYGGEVHQGEFYEGEYYEGDMPAGETYYESTGIQEVPQYEEEGVLILGEDW